MMREKVLVLLLVLSLCGNIYLVFFDAAPLGPLLEKVNGSNLSPLFGNSNSSTENEFYIDENGEIIVFPSPSPTPEINPGNGNADNSSDEVLDGEVNGSETLPTTEVTVIPTETEPIPLDPWVTYNSTKYGFSIRYPRNWTVNEVVAGRTVLTLTAPIEKECDSETSQCYDYIARFTVEIDQKPYTIVLEDYFNRAVSQLQLEYHITTTSKSAPAVMSDTRAYQIEYYTHDKRGNADRSFMQYYVIIDGKAYIISYFGPYSSWENVYNHNKGDAQRIVDSMSITRVYKPA
ncbi:MAG: hypothetical protein LUQ33_00605 [Methanoregulaceae archaeon]|nr:hypothetical protein [Methanoregulaceae archaeon]